METNKKEPLIDAGFQVGTVQEFLELTDDEMREIEDRIAKEYKSRKTKIYSGIMLDGDSLLIDQEHSDIEPNDS